LKWPQARATARQRQESQYCAIVTSKAVMVQRKKLHFSNRERKNFFPNCTTLTFIAPGGSIRGLKVKKYSSCSAAQLRNMQNEVVVLLGASFDEVLRLAESFQLVAITKADFSGGILRLENDLNKIGTVIEKAHDDS